MVDVNPLHEDGTPKSPEELEQEKASLGGAHVPGSKTDPALLLESLQEEREKRKELEDEIAILKSQNHSNDIPLSDEDIALNKKIQEQDEKIGSLTLSLEEKEVVSTYPVLQEKLQEFKTFWNDSENKGMSMKTAAKAYLVENGLLEAKRKGLEKLTGGPRVVTTTKMSAEEVKQLRETNFKKYQTMLENGQIEI